MPLDTATPFQPAHVASNERSLPFTAGAANIRHAPNSPHIRPDGATTPMVHSPTMMSRNPSDTGSTANAVSMSRGASASSISSARSERRRASILSENRPEITHADGTPSIRSPRLTARRPSDTGSFAMMRGLSGDGSIGMSRQVSGDGTAPMARQLSEGASVPLRLPPQRRFSSGAFMPAVPQLLRGPAGPMARQLSADSTLPGRVLSPEEYLANLSLADAEQPRQQTRVTMSGEEAAANYASLTGAVLALAGATLLDAVIEGQPGPASGASQARPDPAQALAQALAQLQQASTHDELRQLPWRYHQLFQRIEGPAQLEVAGAAAARFEELDARLGDGPDDAIAAFALARLCAIHMRHASEAPPTAVIDGVQRRLEQAVQAFFSPPSEWTTPAQRVPSGRRALAAVSLIAGLGRHRDVRGQLAGWMVKALGRSRQADDVGIQAEMQRLADAAGAALRSAARPSGAR